MNQGCLARIGLGLSLALAAAQALAGAITVTDGNVTATASTCTLAQAIYAANRANNTGGLYGSTPAGATTVDPLRYSATSDAAVEAGTAVSACSGALAGANTITFAAALAGSTLVYVGADNYWYGPNALPPIASAITIDGGSAGVTLRNDNGVRLRFFFIGADAAGSATPGYNMPGAGPSSSCVA